MFRKISFNLLIACAVGGSSLCFSALPSPAQARDYNYSSNSYHNPGKKRFFSNTKRLFTSLRRELPSCSDDRVLSLIEDRTHWANKHTWQNGVEVDQIYKTHEHNEISGPRSDSAERLINRRYCGADVMMSNGKKRYVWFMIEEGQGFASIGWNVEFCMGGLDRWKNNDGGCRTLRH